MPDGVAGSARNFILKLGDGASPEGFASIGAFRSVSMTINGSTVDISDKNSGGWDVLLSGGGQKNVQIQCSGIFKDTTDEVTIEGYALDGSLHNYQVDGLRTYASAFQVTSYQRGGELGAEEVSLTLQSSGALTSTDS